jgi:uncharacterized protein
MSAPAVLIATAKLRSGKEEDFNAWQARHNAVAHRLPGFISSDLIPPTQPDSNEWTIILNFRSGDDLAVWQRSSERAELIGEVAPLLEGGTLGEVARLDGPGAAPGTDITEVIFTKIKSGMDVTYRDWAVRIQVAQAKYGGYRGMYLQPPAEKDGLWTAIIRFDTAEHFDAWMRSPERAELLSESRVFVEQEQLLRLATSFPGWDTDQSANREGTAELENCFARHSGRVPLGDARGSLSQSTADIAGFSRRSDDFHRQLSYRGRHDLYSHAAIYSLVWLVAICRPKEPCLG